MRGTGANTMLTFRRGDFRLVQCIDESRWSCAFSAPLAGGRWAKYCGGMPDPVLYLKAMGAAAVVSAVCVLALGWGRRSVNASRVNSACVLGIGVGMVLGYQVLRLRVVWPPVNGLDRLLTIVLPAVLGIELLVGFPRVPRWLIVFLRMSLAAASGRILLHGSVYLSGPWAAGEVGLALLLWGGSLAAVWVLLNWLAQRSPGVSLPLSVALASQCAGILVMLAGYVSGGAAALPLVASLVGATLALRLITARPATQGTIGIGVVGLFGLLFVGRFFGAIATGSALAVLLAPLLCWATEIPPLRQRPPWLIGTLRLALVAIPLVVVLAGGKQHFDRETAPLLGAQAGPAAAETDFERRP